MKLLLRAVVTGFGLSLGSAIFKEVRTRMGWDEDEGEDDKSKAADKRVNAQDGATDPALQTS
jgi:hypothetical protein